MTTQHDERAELIRRLNFAADNNLMLPPAYAEAFRKAAALLAADGQAGGEVSGLTEEQIEQTLEAADELFQAGAFNDIRRHVRAVSDLRRWLRNLRYTHPQPQAVAQGKPPRIAFEHHWQKTRGGKKSRNELQRHPLQPQTYVNDSANRHWVTWQAAQAAMLSASPAAPAAAQVAQEIEQLIRERDDRDEIIDRLCDAVLGEDRHEWSSAYGFDDAVADVEERINQLHQPSVDRAWARFEQAHSQPAAQVAQPLTELLAAADDVCKTLEHPTHSVNAIQMWRLRDALTAHGIGKDQA